MGRPRIRTLKPEILDDEATGNLSDSAWRLFVSLILLSDDHGRGRAGCDWLDSRVWPYRRDSPRTAASLRELRKAGLVVVFEHEGNTFVHMPGWSKHQRVDNAGRPSHPDPKHPQSRALDDDEPVDNRVSPRTAANLREPPRFAAGSGPGSGPGSGYFVTTADDVSGCATPNPGDLAGSAKGLVLLPCGDSEAGPSPDTDQAENVGPAASQAPMRASRGRPAGKPSKRAKTPAPMQAIDAANRLMDCVARNFPESVAAAANIYKRNATCITWADSIRLLNEQDQIPWAAINDMIEWSQQDQFWRGIILSGAALRKNYDKLVAARARKGQIPRFDPRPAQGNVFDVVDRAAADLENARKGTA